MTTVKQEIAEKLRSMPDPVFWAEDPKWKPNYRGILCHMLKDIYPNGIVPVEAFADEKTPNPATFQRSVAREAKRRRQMMGVAYE